MCNEDVHWLELQVPLVNVGTIKLQECPEQTCKTKLREGFRSTLFGERVSQEWECGNSP
jgi:hypothetical protein